jgi:hypothetical protein
MPKRAHAVFITLSIIALLVTACQPEPSEQELLEQGEEVYTVACSRCHQPDGMGVDPSLPRAGWQRFRNRKRALSRGGCSRQRAWVVCLRFGILYPGRRSRRLYPISAMPGGTNASIVTVGQVVAPSD